MCDALPSKFFENAPGALHRAPLTLLISSLILLVPCAVNGWPFVFPDSMEYLSGEPLIYRSYYYQVIAHGSLGIGVIWSGIWSLLLFQAALTSYVVYLFWRTITQLEGFFIYLVIIITIFTSVSYFVGLVMPDIFTSLMFLSMYMIVFRMRDISRATIIFLLLVICFSIAFHASNLPIAVCLLVVGAACLRLTGVDWLIVIRRLVVCAAAVLMATGLAFASNAILYHWKTISGPGQVFLMANLIEGGPGLKYLQKTCQTKSYAICQAFDQLPPRISAMDILWGKGILKQLGGFRGAYNEAAEIVRNTILSEPVATARFLGFNFIRALRTTSPAAHIGSAEAYPWIPQMVGTLLGPGAYRSYMSSLQARGLWPVSVIAAANRIFLPLTWVGLLALGIASWLLGDRDSCSLAAFVTAGYAANALICSSISGVHERYQARMTWLFMLVLIAVGVHLYRLRAYRVIPAASPTAERSVWHSARPPKGALPSDEIVKRAIK